jgi:hemolysin-activating ACP:hemolysin acyltransferase
MDFIFDKKIIKDIYQVISLYKKFDRYKINTKENLYYHLLPSFKLNQYKIHKNGDEVIAFTNWAFLDKESSDYFVQTGFIDDNKWNSGNIVWHVDTVCVKDIKKVMRWTKQYFTNLLGLGKPVHWLRVDDNDNIYRRATRYTKEIYK